MLSRPLLLLVLVPIAAAVLAGLFRRRWTGVGSIGTYQARPLLTDNEVEFYRRLCEALPRHDVMVQVAMGALLRPIATRDRWDDFRLRERYARQIVDFVICDRATLAPVAVVELDDRTHDPGKDAARDALLAAAGYSVIRWDARRKPGTGEIAAAIRAKMQPRIR